MPGKIFTITGPSGVGKTTIVRMVTEKHPRIVEFISHTTRPIREGEVNGIDYYFINENDFKYFDSQKQFFEKTEYSGNKYACSYDELERIWDLNCDGLLVAEPFGVEQIADRFGKNHVAIYMMARDEEEYRNRMIYRGDSDEDIDKRMKTLPFFQSSFNSGIYDYVILNHRIRDAVGEVIDAIRVYA